MPSIGRDRELAAGTKTSASGAPRSTYLGRRLPGTNCETGMMKPAARARRTGRRYRTGWPSRRRCAAPDRLIRTLRAAARSSPHDTVRRHREDTHEGAASVARNTIDADCTEAVARVTDQASRRSPPRRTTRTLASRLGAPRARRPRPSGASPATCRAKNKSVARRAKALVQEMTSRGGAEGGARTRPP
jgi:hypothetical protein